MTLLFLALAVLVSAVLLTLVLLQDASLLMVHYGVWDLELPLTLALALLLTVYLSLYLALRFIVTVWNAPGRLRAWQRANAQEQARQALIPGLLSLAEGQWTVAEHSLIHELKAANLSLLHYWLAAQAAQGQNAADRRDHYLECARQLYPTAEVALRLTQAELQLAQGQTAAALASLAPLRARAARHPAIARLLRLCYEQENDWSALLELLPDLRRARQAREADLHALELRARRGLLLQRSATRIPLTLVAYWESLPRIWRNHVELVETYSACLLECGETYLVENLLKDYLEHGWSARLVECYGRLESADPARQLNHAEGWLIAHPQDPSLLLTLGRLCLRNRLWGKARTYFEASLNVAGGSRPVAYRELGSLLEQMGETAAALICYRQGLRLTTAIELPAPPNSPQRLLTS